MHSLPPLAQGGPCRFLAPSPRVLASLREGRLAVSWVCCICPGFLIWPCPQQVAALFALPFQKAYLWLWHLLSLCWSFIVCLSAALFLTSVWFFPSGKFVWAAQGKHQRRWALDLGPSILVPPAWVNGWVPLPPSHLPGGSWDAAEPSSSPEAHPLSQPARG